MDLLTRTREAIKAKLDERSAAQAKLDEITAAAEARGEDLNAEESAAFAEARAKLVGDDGIDAQLNELRQREAALVDDEARKAAADDLAKRLGDTVPRPQGGASAKSRPVYGPDSARSWVGDAYAAHKGDFRASERIAQQNDFELTEARQAGTLTESRDVGTSAFGAFVVPQYLTELWAPLPRAGRAFSNLYREVPLPDEGMTVAIPRITTGSATAAQTENNAVQETNMDETTLSVSVVTIAGQQDVSRQAIERGRMIEAVVFGDLLGSYNVVLDTAVITEALAVSGIGAVTYTDASPTVAEVWPKLANAVQTVNSNRYAPATAIAMHPRRWGWFTAALDSTNRPLVSLEAPQNPVGVGTAAEYGNIVGQMLGLPVITDANLPTNLGSGTDEDIIVVLKSDDCVLMEDAGPKQLRFDETGANTLTVKLVLFNYAAYTAGRQPKSLCTVGGTGLVAPTF